MNFLPIFSVALRALLRNKVRSLLTALGIIMGIASVIAMMAIGQGATSMIQTEMKSMGNNLLIIFPGSSKTRGMRGGQGSMNTLKVEDADALAREVPYLAAITPLMNATVRLVYQENNWVTRVSGVNADYPIIRDLALAAGDFFSEADLRASVRVCVIGATVAKQLFGGQDPVGATIRVNNMPFQVVGLLAKKGSSAFGQDQDDTLILPYTTFRRSIASSSFDHVDQLLVSLRSMSDLDPATDMITTILRERHRLAEGADDDFNVTDLTEVTQTISQVSVIMTVLLTVIASISLLVGGIGIMNIMLVSVSERTREIGLRMAVGAKARDIMVQFLIESMVLAVAGGTIGVTLGVVAARVLASVANWPVLISPVYVAISLGFAATVGIFFGFYPAWRAARLNPIEALRHE